MELPGEIFLLGPCCGYYSTPSYWYLVTSPPFSFSAVPLSSMSSKDSFLSPTATVCQPSFSPRLAATRPFRRHPFVSGLPAHLQAPLNTSNWLGCWTRQWMCLEVHRSWFIHLIEWNETKANSLRECTWGASCLHIYYSLQPWRIGICGAPKLTIICTALLYPRPLCNGG